MSLIGLFPVYHIFCQYTRFVDKFKPSRGYFNIQVTPWIDYENETGKKYVSMDLWELGKTVEFITASITI